MCPECGGDDIAATSYDFGRDPDTGYCDAGWRGRCRGCGFESDAGDFDVRTKEPRVDGDLIDYSGLPARLRETFRCYFEYRCHPGLGVYTMLCNDLSAVAKVDEPTLHELPTIWRWMYNRAPGAAWGSTAKVAEWLQPRGNEHVHPLLRGAVNAAAREGL